MAKVIVLLLAYTIPIYAINWKTFRRVTLALACSAMASDAVTTSRNRVEHNPLLREVDGSPNMPLIVGVKVATCGSLVIVQEKWKHEKVWTGFNIGTTITLGAVSWRNKFIN